MSPLLFWQLQLQSSSWIRMGVGVDNSARMTSDIYCTYTVVRHAIITEIIHTVTLSFSEFHTLCVSVYSANVQRTAVTTTLTQLVKTPSGHNCSFSSQSTVQQIHHNADHLVSVQHGSVIGRRTSSSVEWTHSSCQVRVVAEDATFHWRLIQSAALTVRHTNLPLSPSRKSWWQSCGGNVTACRRHVRSLQTRDK